MLKIKKGLVEKVVPLAAYIDMYEELGYEIVADNSATIPEQPKIIEKKEEEVKEPKKNTSSKSKK